MSNSGISLNLSLKKKIFVDLIEMVALWRPMLLIYECLPRIASSTAINEGPAFLAKHLQRSLMKL